MTLHFQDETSQRFTKRLAALACCAAAAVLPLGAMSASAAPPAINDQLWIANDRVRSVAIVEDTLYLGGDFTHVGPPTGFGAAIDATTGDVDLSWPPVNGVIYDVAGDGSGGFYIAGRFSTVGGQPRTNVAHIHADGTLDPHWNPVPNSRVKAIAVLGDMVYLGGEFTKVNDERRIRMAAISTDGQLTSFTASTNGNVLAILPHQNRLFIGGAFSIVEGFNRGGVAELDPLTGEVLDLNIGSNPVSFIAALAAVGNTLYVGGGLSLLGGAGAVNIDSGALLPWSPDPNGYVQCLVADSDAVYIGGIFTRMDGTQRFGVAAVDPVTAEVLPFHADLDVNGVYAMDLAGDELFIAGGFREVGDDLRSRLAMVDATTGAAFPWQSHAGDYLYALAREGNTLYAGGQSVTYGAVERQGIAALDLSTGEPTSFNPGVFGSVNDIEPSDTETLYVSGGFGQIGGAVRPYLAELDRFTGAATNWTPPVFFPPAAINTISHDEDTVYVGGEFDGIPGVAVRYSLAALTRATGALLPWNPTASLWVYDLVFHEDTVYAAGNFTHVGGATRYGFAGLDPDTGLATPLDLMMDSDNFPEVYEFEIVNEVLYLVGDIETAQGEVHQGGVAYNLQSNTVLPWNPDGAPAVFSLAVTDEVIYLGGQYMRFGGEVYGSAAAVDATTGELLDWNPQPLGVLEAALSSPGLVDTALSHGDYIYLAGDFVDVANGSGHAYLAAVRALEMCTADLDGDGDTDQADLGILLAAYDKTDAGDLDSDGDTDQADLGALLANYGCGTQ